MQLTYWLSVPAEWRCRKCGYRFIHEPVVSNEPASGGAGTALPLQAPVGREE